MLSGRQIAAPYGMFFASGMIPFKFQFISFSNHTTLHMRAQAKNPKKALDKPAGMWYSMVCKERCFTHKFRGGMSGG